MIAIIAFMPLRVLTANADFSANASSISIHQVETHDVDHQDCNMEASCFTDCQAGTTHCTSTSLVIPSSGHGLALSASYHSFVTNAEHLQSISNRNLFRPPRNVA